MKNPATPTTRAELATAIESLVASYMDGVRDAAQQALARGLARQQPGRRARRARRNPVVEASPSGRRSSAALSDLSRALCDFVRAQPGSSMVELSERLGAPLEELKRPMARLRAEGKVRVVGQRQMMRYYPAVVRAGKE